jgi:hypothetical protein
VITARSILIVLLALNGAVVFGYRVYRLTKGGPMADALGAAILAAIVAVLAIAVAAEAGWGRWGALFYSALFGLAVMPVWTLAVLIPMRPRLPDYVFTAVYWASLLGIAGAAVVA